MPGRSLRSDVIIRDRYLTHLQGYFIGLQETQNLFQNEKSVLPGTVDLKHETAICVVVKGELQRLSKYNSGPD